MSHRWFKNSDFKTHSDITGPRLGKKVTQKHKENQKRLGVKPTTGEAFDYAFKHQ